MYSDFSKIKTKTKKNKTPKTTKLNIKIKSL